MQVVVVVHRHIDADASGISKSVAWDHVVEREENLRDAPVEAVIAGRSRGSVAAAVICVERKKLRRTIAVLIKTK